MKFIDHTEVKFHIPNGVYLTSWLLDNLENREVLERFHNQVMKNENRKAIYVNRKFRLGHEISLYVNRVASNSRIYRKAIHSRKWERK